MKAKRFILERYFEGMPKESDLKLVEEELPEIKDGEFLVKAVYLSVDPYMRAYVNSMKLGQTMIGCQVAKIIESKNVNYPVGRYLTGQFGWSTHCISDGTPQDITNYPPFLIPEENDVPLSLYLGILGRTGNSAYFGLLDICKPQPGETVAVTGAGGAVGYHVGQIAKIKGCTVIGITGSDDKARWLSGLGFDHVINYKTEDVNASLSLAAAKGIDCYFDNVGGEISSCVIQRMNKYGRIAVCGSISSYNATPATYPTGKRRGKLHKGVFLYHDNAPSHKYPSTAIAHEGLEIVQHPPFLSDLSPSNYQRFPKLKEYLCGKRFPSTNMRARIIQPSFVFNELYMKGFVVRSYLNRWMEGIDQNMKWFKEGKLQSRETLAEGFRIMPKALIGLMSGENMGKAIVKV